MKKLKLLAVCGFVMCIGLAVASCGKETLETPTGFNLETDYQLTWTAVKGAMNYEIEITDANGNKTTFREKRSNSNLTELITEIGDYEIRVRAIANERDNKNSDWSEVIPFQKAYESGCLFQLRNNAEYELIKGVGTGNIVLEDTFRKKPVTAIAEGAFKGLKYMTGIEIGDYVEMIADSAFYNCTGLVSIDIPDTVVSIGKSAFENCKSLASVELSSAVTKIQEHTFAYCRELSDFNWNGAKIEEIGESAFSDCAALVQIEIPESVKAIGPYAFASNSKLEEIHIGKNVARLGEYALSKCVELQTVTFADDCGLKTIEPFTFYGCSVLSGIVLPVGLTNIEQRAFDGATNLDDIQIPDTVRQVGSYAFWDTQLYKKQSTAHYVYADDWLIGISENVRAELTALTPTTLKSGVVGIAAEVFSGCAKLEEVKFANTVRYIGSFAFYVNPALWSVTTNKVEYIGNNAFQGCKALSYLVLGETYGNLGKSLKEIGAYAFYDCSSLENDLYGNSLIPSSVERIGTYAFKKTIIWDNPDEYGVVYAGDWIVGYDKLKSDAIEIKDGTRGIADYAFYRCKDLVSVIGMGKPQIIGRAAFYECSSLSSATLNNKITEIKDYTFYKCTGLYSVKTSPNLERIGRSAFYKCESLENVDLSQGMVTDIDAYAFYGCKNVQSVNFGDMLENVGTYAFYECTSLEEVSLPNSMKELGRKSFAKCSALTEIDFGDGLKTIGDYAFQACANLKDVTIGKSVETIGNYAFYKCFGLETLELGEKVSTIGNYAFFANAKLNSLVLPESVDNIGNYAFKGCVGLDALLLTSDVRHIGDHAFYGCTSATVYTDAAAADYVAWNARWNSSFRPIVWGCTLSEDKTYVVSVTVQKDTLEYGRATGGFTAPTREGFTFGGWKDGNGNTILASEIESVPFGTTLVAEWLPV